MTTIVADAPFAKVRFESRLHQLRGRRGQKRICDGPPQAPEPVVHGRVPRIARLMALAVRMRELLEAGHVADQAELARLGHVTRARVTQIMNLLSLAPDIQEQILFLPPIERGRDRIREWQLRPIALVPDWRKQRRMWRELQSQAGPKSA